ncbi:MAG: type IV pilus biogenesis/stability protein PilW [Alphaproteobacteria bacterium]
MAGLPVRWIRGLCVLGCALAVFCAAGRDVAAADDGEANRLFVGAVLAVRKADALPIRSSQGRALLYGEAALKLNKIIVDHPDSDLAVKLVAGEPIGDITLWGVARKGLLAGAAICLDKLNPYCLLETVDPLVKELADAGAADGIQRSRAWIFAKRGDFDKARQAVDSIRAGLVRAMALGYLAGWKAEFGERQKALDVLEEAKILVHGTSGGLDRIDALSEMAWAYAKLGEMGQARALWREADSVWQGLTNKYDRVVGKSELAYDKLDVDAVAEAEPDLEWLDSQLTDAGKISAYRAQTFDVRDMIDHSFMAARAEVAASFSYAIAGREADAARSLSTIEQFLGSSGHLQADTWLLANLADAQARLGRFDDALATARAISADEHRAYALLWIAASRLDAKEPKAAREILFDALGAAEGLDSRDRLASFIVDVAVDLAESASAGAPRTDED